jgi:uncharacterized protein (DUF305 family)
MIAVRMVRLLCALALVAGAAACSSGDGPPVLAPGRPGEPARTVAPGETVTVAPPNAADVRYLQNMIIHHQQAIEMAKLVPDRAASADVKRIADRIAGTQGPEIDAMNAWLRAHGQPAVEPGEHAAHAEHDPATMPGMATADQLQALAAARGPAFDTLFLQLMITHHQGALTMAGEIQTKGADVRVQEIADDVIASQTAEINRMRALLPH